EALQLSKPESARLEVTRAPGGYTVINDAYNANPDSMRASLNLFAALEVPGKRFAVLGDMGELGSFAPAMHEEVGAYAAASSLDWLVCVGELAVHIAQGAKQAGFPEDKIVQMRTKEDALAFVKEHVVSGDAVLVKASHSMELDQVAKGLLN
ncbi:MAG: cyanophycin synthetase, partial [Eggerthellaceae bacterium]